MKKNTGEVVLITGAAGGIGKVTCEFLSAKGYQVYGTGSYKPEAADTLPYQWLELDINHTDSVKNCIKSITDEAGRIDILINNAGYSYHGSLVNISLEDMIRQYNVNVFGAMRMIQGVVPHMLEQGSGRIINIGSIGGRLPLPFQAAYSSSKAALMNITDSLKIELLHDGIKVCLIEPGNPGTDSTGPGDPEAEDYPLPSLAAIHQAEKKGLQPVMVADVIHKAIISPNPRPRYIVGSDASLINFINRLLPPFLRRKLVKSLYKIPGQYRKK